METPVLGGRWEARRLLALLTALMLAVTLVVMFTESALADHVNDGGVDMAWSEAMNQESYWEAHFARPGVSISCTKWHNHSGVISAAYGAAVIKNGTMVRVYDKPGPFTALGPVNPANGKHFEPPHSWVMKCKFVSTTTTTQATTTTTQPTTTTTQPTTTTTVEGSTTSTMGSTTTTEGSTTTTEGSTTTTEGSTTTTEDSTTTTVNQTGTTVPLATTTTDEVLPTVVTTTTVPDPELPLTGARADVLFGLAVVLMAMGLAVLTITRDVRD